MVLYDIVDISLCLLKSSYNRLRRKNRPLLSVICKGTVSLKLVPVTLNTVSDIPHAGWYFD